MATTDDEPATSAGESLRFPLGGTYITPGVQMELSLDEIHTVLSRHQRGDWREVPSEDRDVNELSLREGFRILSAYTTRSGKRVWIIIEADRSAMTVLLPEEY
jgi:hypothetical protein